MRRWQCMTANGSAKPIDGANGDSALEAIAAANA
jgi:hypothetical protein